MHAPPVGDGGASGGASARVSSPTARPHPPGALPHAGSSERVATWPPAAASPGFATTEPVHGDAPVYVPVATSGPPVTSTRPSVSNAPASLPSAPNTENRGTLPRSMAAPTSSALSVQDSVRMTSGATAGRPPAPCGHISPTTSCRPGPTLGRGRSTFATGPGSGGGKGGFTVGVHAEKTRAIGTPQATRGGRPGSLAITWTIPRPLQDRPIPVPAVDPAKDGCV